MNEGGGYKKLRVKKSCNVVVIGGGTAGLEAACTAAEVGCTTFLIEKKANLGGLAAEISKIPDKRDCQIPELSDSPCKQAENLIYLKIQKQSIEFG